MSYIAKDLKKLFDEIGLECNLTLYESYGAIRLYTLTGKKVKEPETQEIISNKLLSIRETQLKLIEEILYEQLEEKKTDSGFICIAQHFDYVAIRKQIADYKKEPLSLSYFEIFKYYLNLYEGKIGYILDKKSRNLRDIPWFHDRGYFFKIFTDEFLNSFNNVLFLSSPRTLGKTTFALQALKTRNPERKPLYIEVPKNCDYWSFIENLFIEMEVDLEYDKLLTENKQKITEVILRFIKKFSKDIILCFDEFENAMEKYTIADADLEEFLSKLSKVENIKCFFISNRQLLNINEVFNNFVEHKLGLLPKDYHVGQILDSLIVKKDFGIIEYPPELVSAVGRHPAIAFLVGKNIKKYGSLELVMQNKIDSIKKGIISSMLEDIDLTPSEEKILCTMSLFVSAEHFNLIEKIVEDTNAFASLVEKGLIYFVGTKYFIVDTLKEYFQKRASRLDTYNEIVGKILEAYTHEFKNSKGYLKIKYYRKLINFRLFKGETDVDLDPNNEYYSSELAELAEIYFRYGYYDEALKIFEKLISNKKSKIKYQLRYAGCLVRLKKPEGKKYYEELIERYDYNNIKTSYIQSLIAIKDYRTAFEKLGLYFGLDINEYHQLLQHPIQRTKKISAF